MKLADLLDASGKLKDTAQQALYEKCCQEILSAAGTEDLKIVCLQFIIHGFSDFGVYQNLIQNNQYFDLTDPAAFPSINAKNKSILELYTWSPLAYGPAATLNIPIINRYLSYITGAACPPARAVAHIDNRLTNISTHEPFIEEFLKQTAAAGIDTQYIDSVDCCLFDYKLYELLHAEIGSLDDTTGDRTKIANLVSIFAQVKANNGAFDDSVETAIQTAIAAIKTAPAAPVQPAPGGGPVPPAPGNQPAPGNPPPGGQPQPQQQFQQVYPDQHIVDLVDGLAMSQEQYDEAMSYIDSVLNGTVSNPMAPYLENYVKGISERAVIQILDKNTSEGAHKVDYNGGAANPHSNLVGGRYYTSSKNQKPVNPVQLPRGFKHNESIIMWDRPVITAFGYPFINFTSKEVNIILHSNDKAIVKKAYKRVKKLLVKTGISSPVKLLQEFAHAKGIICTMNPMAVDSTELINALPETKVSARTIDSYDNGAKYLGSCQVSDAFLATFYTILPPVEASGEYCKYCSMTESDYANYLNEKGKPPVYILTPKPGASFVCAPGGGFLHNLFSSKKKPILVQAKIDNHIGGFVIPERDAEKLFRK